MNCDFCGAEHAYPMSIPTMIEPNPVAGNPLEWFGWGHPLTGNVCRECLVGQLLKASGGQLIVKPSELSRRLMALSDVLLGASATSFLFGHFESCGVAFGLAIVSAAISSITRYPTKRDGKK